MNMNSKCNIFISYRREGGRELARTLRLALANLGYDNIFFDYNSLRDGMFNDQIITAINECNDFVLVLTPGSMDRCVNEDDWVRREITEALEVGSNIIPVLIDDKEVIYPEEFPRRLNVIKNIQASKLLTNEFFEESVKRITERLHSQSIDADVKQDGFVLTIHTDETCILFINGESNMKIKKGKAYRLSILSPGEEYSLEFHSLAIKKDIIKKTYQCPQINKTDEITISFNEMRASKKNNEILEREKKHRERETKRSNKQNLKNALQHYEKSDVSVYDGIMLVQKGEVFGYLDEKGLEIIMCQYENALHFLNGVACVKKDGKWGFINKYGQIVIPFESETPSYYSNNLIVVCKKGKYGAIDIEGNIRIPFNYDYLSQPSDKVILGRLGNEYLLMTLEGEEINPYRFDDISIEPIPLGIDANEKLQYWDYRRGSYVLQEFPDFFEKCPVVPSIIKKNERYGYIDSSGKLIIPIIAEAMYYPYKGHDSYEKKYLITQYRGKMGVFNALTGSIIIPFEYELLEYCDRDNSSFFRVGDNIIGEVYHTYRTEIITDTMGAIDINGNFIIPMEYNHVFICEDKYRILNFYELEIDDYMYFFYHNYRQSFIAIKVLEYKSLERVADLIDMFDFMYSFSGKGLDEFQDLHYIIEFYVRETSQGKTRTVKFLKKEHIPGEGYRTNKILEVLFERDA